MSIRYEYHVTGKTQADGSETVSNDLAQDMTNATTHQVSVVPEEATSGTVAVMIKPFGAPDFYGLVDEFGADVMIDVALPKTYIFEGNIDAMRFDPTSVNGTYGIVVSGW